MKKKNNNTQLSFSRYINKQSTMIRFWTKRCYLEEISTYLQRDLDRMNFTTVQSSYNVIPFDDTLILYNPRDPVSILCVYLSLSPILLLAFYLSWLIITRELESVIVAGGQLINEFLNKILKRVIKQPRPHVSLMGPGYGMPSAHSQFVGFFLSYWSLKLWLQWGYVQNKIRYNIYLLCFTIAVCLSRVYLLYHTYDQIIIGYVIGILNGIIYFGAVGVVRQLGIIDWVLTWPLCRGLFITDCFNNKGTTLHSKWQTHSHVDKEPKPDGNESK